MKKKLKKILKNTAMLSLVLLVFAGCTSASKKKSYENKVEKHNNNSSYNKNHEKSKTEIVTRIGLIKPRGYTTWMYGSNILLDKDGNVMSALVGKKHIRLVDYEGHDVEVVGRLKEGYPKDNGPEYIEVERIKVWHK